MHNGHRHSIAIRDQGVFIEPITKTGQLLPKIHFVDSFGKIEKIEAILASTDGVHVTITELEKPTQLPVWTLYRETNTS